MKANNTFKIEIINYVCLIKIPRCFRTNNWNAEYGIIQRKLRSLSADKIEHVKVDMTACVWADPLPMLSLCISLAEATKANIPVKIYLPELSEDRNRFMIFMELEGFNDIFEELGIADVFVGDSLINDKDRASLRDNVALQRYSECRIIPAQIIKVSEKTADFDTEAETETIVNDIFENRMINLQDKIPNYALENMRMKLWHILYETVSNVMNHSEQSFFGVYIRYRSGLASVSETSYQYRDIEKLAKEEENTNPTLGKDFIISTEGFVEVFVIDSGVGIIKTMGGRVSGRGHRFSKFFNDVYLNQKRRPDNQKTTTVSGGLDLISNLLKNERDFVHAREGIEFVGFHSSDNPQNINKSMKKEDSKTPLSGLAWIFRLSWKRAQSKNVESIHRFEGKFRANPIYKVMKISDELESEIATKYKSSFCVDDKQGDCIGLFGKERYTYKNIVWLPNELNSKNEILNNLKRLAHMLYFLAHVESKSGVDDFFKFVDEDPGKYIYKQLQNINSNEMKLRKIFSIGADVSHQRKVNELINLKYGNMKIELLHDKTLLILGVSDYEMIIYKNALNGSRIYDIDKEVASKVISDIIVCSKHFDILAFTLHEGLFAINDARARDFIKNSFQTTGLLTLQGAYLWTMWRNSIRFWDTLFSQDTDSDSYFKNVVVQWNDEKEITGYLHLENIISNPELYGVISDSVECLSGLFTDKECRYDSGDLLVKQLVDECNVKNFSESGDLRQNVIVESIYVTGITANGNLCNSDEENTLRCCLFFHANCNKPRESENSIVSTLFWQKQDKINEKKHPNKKRYARVGRTPFIMEEDTNSLPYIVSDESFRGNVYSRNVEQKYVDFQRAGFNAVRIGHFEYDGFHNFFQINYGNIFHESRLSKKGVFAFLVITLFYSLLESKNNNYIQQLIEQCAKDWQKVLTEAKNEYLGNVKNKEWFDVGIVIYASHHFTTQLVRDLDYILPKGYMDRFVPISTYVSLNKQGVVIPPTSKELLRSKLEKYCKGNKKHIIFFDTFIESGKTRKQLKHILLSKEFNKYWNQIGNIKTLSVIDSFRFLYSAPNAERHRSYWRIDLPRLGDSRSCSFCSAIKVSDEIKQSFAKRKDTDRDYTERLKSWQSNWSTIPALKVAPKAHGISPSYFGMFDTAKISPKYEPAIKTNIGLALYSNELQSVQLDDNIIVEILKKVNDPELIVLLIASRLILFGNWASEAFHLEMLGKLLKSLSEIQISKIIDVSNNYSSLAALILLLQDDKHIFRAWLEVSENFKYGNLDIEIALSWFARKNKGLYLGLPFKVIRVLDNADRRSAYDGFHKLLCNVSGRIHNKNIEKFCGDGFSGDYQIAVKCLTKANNDLQSVLKYLSHIHAEELCEKQFDYDQLRKDIATMDADVATIKDSDKKCSVETQIKIQNKFTTIFNCLKKWHEALFISAGMSGDHIGIVEKIHELVNKANRSTKSKIEISSIPNVQKTDLNLSEIWYFWNADVESSIEFLLDNVQHAREEFLVNGKNAYMSVEIERALDYCKIILHNKSSEDSETVKKDVLRKFLTRNYEERSKGLGVEFNWSSKKEGEWHDISTEITIPALEAKN